MNTSIIQKLWIYSSLFFTLLMVQMTLLINITSEIKDNMYTNADIIQPMNYNFHQLQIGVLQTQQWLTDISATRARDGLDDGFDEAENASQQFKQTISQLAKLDPTQADKYRSLLPIYQAYYKTGQKMALAYIDQGPDGGNKIMAEFDTTAEAINSKVDQFVDEFRTSNNAVQQQQKEDSQQLENLNYIFSLAYFILLSILIIGGTTYVTSPAKKLVETLQRIAYGDLTQILEVKNKDELGDIALTTNQIVKELGGTLKKVSSQGWLISAYSHATVLVVHDTANGIDKQKVHANEIIQVISGMNDSVEQIDLLSIQAQQKAQLANEEANTGKHVVEQSILAINSLATDLKQAEQSIQSLVKASEQISTVLNVIQDIAEQTNLLALNAAIEAARAGEQGRGFAVVADEVRTLAARTQGSAQEIKTMIEELQSGTKEAVNMMDKSHSQAKKTVEQSEKAGDSLQAIAESADLISQLNNQIATATKSQKLVSGEVNLKINEIVKLIEDVQKQSATATKMGAKTRQNASNFTHLIKDLKV